MTQLTCRLLTRPASHARRAGVAPRVEPRRPGTRERRPQTRLIIPTAQPGAYPGAHTLFLSQVLGSMTS